MSVVKQIIPAGFRKEVNEPIKYEPNYYLRIAEFFTDTIQGENFVGCPATFLRLQGCTLDCIWCDSNTVWRQGNPFTFSEIFELMERFNVIEKLKNGQNLVITGGSPLKQQTALLLFFDAFKQRYNFIPYIEIENECTLMPYKELVPYIACWNNSPKLESSENPKSLRYNPEVLQFLSNITEGAVWFKFVIGVKSDWDEIQKNYLDTNLIKKSQIVLMPLGATRKELQATQEITVELSIEKNVRYSPRLHVDIWDKKTGV